MDKLTRTQFGAIVPNDEVIIAGYGMQYKDDSSSDYKPLKFTRLKTFGFQPEEIQFHSKYAGICPGRFYEI